MNNRSAKWLIPYGFLGLAAVVLFQFNHDWRGFWWTDEARHAMDGVFFRDFFFDLPFTDIRGYLEEYFARFPALGFTWYLPFFAVVESLFFMVFGVTLTAAKLNMLLWYVAAALLTFHYAQRHIGAAAGIAATLLLISNPEVLQWGRSIMLEIPALAMMMLFLIASEKYLDTPSWGRSVAVGIIAFCMLMTKQTVIFMLGVVVIRALATGTWRSFLSPKAIPALLATTIGIAGVIVHAMVLGKSGMAAVVNRTDALLVGWLGSNVPLMIKQMLGWFGIPIWIAAIAGTVFAVRAGEGRITGVLWGWIVLGLLFFPFLTGLEDNLFRYGIYISVPVYMLAARLIPVFGANRLAQAAVIAALVIAALPGALRGLSTEHPYIDGLEDVAEYVASLENKAPVLFCCRHDGGYVFNMRRLDPERRSVTLRADKVLVSIVINPRRGVVEHASTADEILGLLDENAVHYLVLEDRTLAEVPQFQELRAVAEGDQFSLLQEFTLESPLPHRDGTKVRVYRYLAANPIDGKSVSIPFPHLGRTIKLKLE